MPYGGPVGEWFEECGGVGLALVGTPMITGRESRSAVAPGGVAAV